MADITLVTNGHSRELVALAQMDDAARAEFDYVDSNSDDAWVPRFFRYRNSWWDSHDFLRADDSATHSVMHDWDGVFPTSYFDCVLIRYTEDYDAVVAAYAHW